MSSDETGAPSTNLIIGASSQIGQALIAQLLELSPDATIVAVSRSALGLPERVICHRCDYSPEDIARVGKELTPLTGSFTRIIICNGILHHDTLQPEKRLEDLDLDNMAQVFRVNAILPALWLKTLAPLLPSKQPCRIALFSARVGSISDNRAGGWYSYRASKAALNMLTQSAAIEFARRAKNVKLLAFHPGTVATPLSAPFQRNVPEGKLFTPEYVARQLLNLLTDLPVDGSASYLDYAGKPITW